MKRTSVTLAAIAASMGVVFGSAALADQVTVSVGEPGFYGRLELGDAPKPVLIDPRPVIIERERVVEEPTYVYVPAEQQHDWANYCGKYDACGRPVYFVDAHWYNDVYVPAYRSKHELKKEAKRDYKDSKREAKRDFKDAKRDARHPD